MVRQLFTEPDYSSQRSQEQANHPHPQPNQSRSHFLNIFITAMSTAGRATWLWAERSGVLLHGGAGDFSQFQNVLHALRTAQPSVQWVLGLFAESKATRAPSSSSAKVKKEWGYTYNPLYSFMTWTGQLYLYLYHYIFLTLWSLALRFTDQL
jgi:hypothetical protein